MVPLAESLAEEGWTVSIPHLAGHDGTAHDLVRTTALEWLASAERSYAELGSRCARLAVIGLSMGGALGLCLAAAHGARAVVAVSTPSRLRPVLAAASRAASRVMPVAPVLLQLGPRDPAVRPFKAPRRRFPLGSTGEVTKLLATARAALPRLLSPLLVVQGRKDWVIPRRSGAEIVTLASLAPSTFLWLPRSGHVATLDRDREVLFKTVREFLRRHL